MSTRLRLWFCCCTALAACTPSAVLLQGAEGVYAVPARHMRDSPGWTYGNPANYDQHPVLALDVPLADIGLRSDQADDRLGVMIFSDRRHRQDLRIYAKLCIDADSKEEAQTGWFVWVTRWRNETKACHFTRNPQTLATTFTEDDFMVERKVSAPWAVGGKTFTPRGGCTFHLVRDGMLVYLSTLGALCSVEHFQSTVQAFDRLLNGWRQNVNQPALRP